MKRYLSGIIFLVLVSLHNVALAISPTGVTANASPNPVCSGGSLTLTGTATGATSYSWAGSDGFTSTAQNPAAYTVNTVSAVSTITYTFTATNGSGSTIVFKTVTVNPLPTVNPVAGQAVCNGAATTAINFTGSGGATFNWTNGTPSIGLAASGSGDIGSFTATNAGTSPVAATITVTPVSGSCSGVSQTAIITVNPTPSVSAVAGQTLCNNTGTTPINFSGSAVAGTTYNWVNGTPSIGLASSGSGNIPAFTALNGGSTNVVATLIVTPVANGCNGATQTTTITVKPSPSVTVSPSSQSVCNGASSAAISFSGSPVAGTTYNWTNGSPSIGLAPSGSGNIPAFAVTNGGSSAVMATITVTPTAGSCPGVSQTATITANPTPGVSAVAAQTICNGAATTPINFTGSLVAGTTYNWLNSTPSIGLAPGGSGNISSFTASNGGSTNVVATLTVTPVASGCQGSSQTTTITVKPSPSVTVSPSSQVVCNNSTTSAISFSGSPIAGTTYSWTNSAPTIGLGSNGTGNIASFTASNGGSSALIATITVTPSATGCPGVSQTTTITINATPSVSPVAAQSVCNGANTAPMSFSGSSVAGTTYNWTNSTTSIGLGSGGTGNIPAFTAVNTGSVNVVGTITVTPSANGCFGNPQTTTITVKPSPSVTISLPSQSVCNNSSTTAIHFSGSAVAGTTYNWTNSTTSIGLGVGGSGDIGAFTAANTTTGNVVATITVTPTVIGCSGASQNATITVKPTPNVIAPASQTVCNNANTATVNFAGVVGGSTYTWTNSNASIGVAASGTGNITSFTAANTSSAPVTANFTVTPSAAGCTGAAHTFTITVNPSPVVTFSPGSQQVCNNASSTAETFSSSTAGATFAWTNTNTSVGLGASGSGGSLASFTALNTTNAPVTTTISVIPTANSCSGTAQTLTITINPTPSVASVTSQTLCSQSATNAVAFSGPVSGTTYNWSNGNSSIGLASSGTGNISSFTATNTSGASANAVITITPSANGCTGAAATFNFVVNPLPATPVISIVPPAPVCQGTMSQNFGAASAAASGETYYWTASGGAAIWAQEKTSHQNCLVNFTSGTAIITLTDSNATSHCRSHTQTTINVTSSVAPHQDTVISFESNLICLENGATYQWGFDDTATLMAQTVSGETSQNYYLPSPVMTNDYWVKITDPSTTCYQKSYWSVPAGNRAAPNTGGSVADAIKVYPNPANNYLDIELDNAGANTSIKITDMLGREVMVLPLQNQKTTVDISVLRPSLYLLEYYKNGVKMADSRFIKK